MPSPPGMVFSRLREPSAEKRYLMTGLTQRMKNASLTQKEQAVMERITGEINKTAFLSGIQLAEECGVSATFITRLVHKLGYEKFADFKEELGERYRKATSPYDMFQNFAVMGGMTEVVKSSIVQDLANLSSMEKLLDPRVLEQVVDSIDQCRKVYMVAMFASEVAVQMMGHYLWRLGKPYESLTGVGLSKKVEFSDVGKGDVLLAFSSQRVLKEVRDAVLFAKKQGAVTIAITDNAANPLACASDHVLLAPVQGVAVDYTHVATLAMLDLIVNSLAQKNPEIVAQSLEKESSRCDSRDLFCL